MNFNSVEFLIFLPVVLLLYWLIPHKFRWILLLVASYYFYMSWNAALIFLIFGTTAVSYAAGLCIEKAKSRRVKKFWFVLTLVVCLGSLAFFKYFNFFLQSIIDFLNLFALHLNDFSLNILLPVGISFYTFQTLSYVIDVYRGAISAEHHFGYYALFVSYFPQLVAGPIERPGDLIPQLKTEQKWSGKEFVTGLRILLVGFFYKCVVADFLGIYVTNVFSDSGNANGLSVAIAGALFTVQMYCDFAGYSEIATGSARMMGVRLTRNFNRPYLAVSYSDFFRRWHITLTRWFTDYLYISLGGSRKGTGRRILNTFIVFLLCGLWHGANWTYVLWGAYAAFFLSLESVLKKPLARFLSRKGVNIHGKLITMSRRSIMWLIFIPAAILFRAEDVAQAGEMLVELFTAWGLGVDYFNAAMDNIGLNVLSGITIVLCIVCMTKIFYFGEVGREEELPVAERTVTGRKWSIYMYIIILIGVCWVALLSTGDISSFAYFQF